MPKVLVVDDSASCRRLVGGLLEQGAYEVELAKQAAEALDSLNRAIPDLVIVDVMMPGKSDGNQLVDCIRDQYPQVPVILMTSHGREQQAIRALRNGAASYVPKRLLAGELLDTVRHVLNVASSRHGYVRVMDCLEKSDLHFRLDNDCSLVMPLVGYLQDTIQHLHVCSDSDRTRLGIALEEAIVNAIFHGNLEVSSCLREQNDDAYRDLINQRRRIAPYSDRRVHVHANLSHQEARFAVRDEGPGFDPHSLPDPTDPGNLDRVCGRGVLLMRTFMDEVFYNSQGNEVTMVKRRQRATTDQV
ncbi:MAG: ATP-binding protein [Planctomycetota bacterium]|nr:ATP-binding protein [Planctomycetota bacterium]MDA1179913.1 ATP-binding protein [Planctomycetota bacterium]